MLRYITLGLDELDYDAVQRAMAHLQSQRFPDGGCAGIPEGDSDLAGGLLAEVCRGYLDLLGLWPCEGDKRDG